MFYNIPVTFNEQIRISEIFLCVFIHDDVMTYITDFVFLTNVHCWNYWNDSPKISRNTKYGMWILEKDCRAAAVLRQFVLWRIPTDEMFSHHQKVNHGVILTCQNYACVHYRWKCRILNISLGYYTPSWQTLIPSTLQEMHMKNKLIPYMCQFCFVSVNYVSWL